MPTRQPVLRTEFAPAERAAPAELRRQHAAFARLLLVPQLLEAMPSMVMALNGCRQVIYHNRRLSGVLKERGLESGVGLRPGEVVDCIHSDETPGGCGTTRFCRHCGAVKAILAGLEGRAAMEDCRITTHAPGGSLDLRVWATPFTFGRDQRCVIFSVQDIAHEKRREALENVFFHDILNTAGAVRGAVEFLAEASQEEAAAFRAMASAAADKLIEEIRSQRDLNAAERGELSPQRAPVSASSIVREAAGLYRRLAEARGRWLHAAEQDPDLEFLSDKSLVRRVVGNMVKNGLEASTLPGTVLVSWRRDGDGVVFEVRNPEVMPEHVQSQVFQRSFSTKAASGRGLGTYGMKLLGEGLLKGRVWFKSGPGAGTSFFARFPLA
ncbi:MAG: ATP-binding protein [Elusimicrobiota bacterium]|jgi:hypothetical protein